MGPGDFGLDAATSMQEMFPNRPTVDGGEPSSRPEITPEQMMRLPVNTLVDMEIIDMVVGRRRASEEWRQQKRRIWDKCWDHYKQVYDASNKEKWQSTTFQPATTKVIEIITANIHGAMMGPDMPVELQTRQQPADSLVRSINEVIQADFEKSKFKAHFTDFLRTLCICGTAIGKIDYVQQRETVMVKERRKPSVMDGMLAKLGIKMDTERFVPKDMLVKDFARFRNVDLYDIYPQPKSTEISKDTWIIEKGKITNRELWEGSQDPDPYYRLDNVGSELLMGGNAERVNEDPEKASRRLALMENQVPMHYLDPDREHELLEYWGQVPIWYLQPELRNDEKRKYESVAAWIWVVDGQYVVRKRISPWRDAEPPYVKGNYIRVPSEFYGIGPAEMIIGLQIEKNEIRNTRMDNVNLILNKITAVLKDKVRDWNRLVSGPGAIWVFEGIDDIRKALMPVDMPDITKDSYLASREVDNEIQETTAAVKATIGVGGDSSAEGGGTFRGQLLNKQVATERFMLYARVLEICGLGDAIRKFYQRIYQFKSYDAVMQILGPQRAQSFEFVPPEDLDKIAKLVPMGVMTLENKGVKLAQMQQFTQMWLGQPFFKPIEMARRQWIEMGFPDPDSILFSDEELQQYTAFKKQFLGAGMPGQPSPSDSGPGGPPPGLLGPNGQPLPPQSAGPIAGNVPGPTDGLPRPAMPARGPGAASIDLMGRPAA